MRQASLNCATPYLDDLGRPESPAPSRPRPRPAGHGSPSRSGARPAALAWSGSGHHVLHEAGQQVAVMRKPVGEGRAVIEDELVRAVRAGLALLDRRLEGLVAPPSSAGCRPRARGTDSGDGTASLFVRSPTRAFGYATASLLVMRSMTPAHTRASARIRGRRVRSRRTLRGTTPLAHAPHEHH